MPTLIYLHGFLSSPLSFKAQATKAWLAREYPNCEFFCPELSAYPAQALAVLDGLADGYDALRLVGSSLGGFWASYLVERHDNARAVLINPAVNPHKVVDSLVGKTLKNYYTEHFYTLTPDCAEILRRMGELKPAKLDQYWLLTQTADETLDYREAVTCFMGGRQTIIEGGNHAFENYEQYLSDIYEFLFEQ